FVDGNEDIRAAALAAAKFVFDLALSSEAAAVPQVNDLLACLIPAEAPQTRSQSKKRKRTPSPPRPAAKFEPTPLSELLINGMDEDQIWAQLDLRGKNVSEMLKHAFEGEVIDDPDSTDLLQIPSDEESGDSEEDEDVDMHDFSGLYNDEDSEDDEEEDGDSESLEDFSNGHFDGEESMEDLRDPSDDEENKQPSDGILERPKRLKRGAHPILDDGFFDLSAFNAETAAAEARSSSKGHLDDDDDDDDDDDMSIDLSKPVDLNDEVDEPEPFYKDFFEPPRPVHKSNAGGPRKSSSYASPKEKGVHFHEQVRVRKIKAKGKGLPVNYYNDDDEDDDENDDGFGGDTKHLLYDENGRHGEDGEEEDGEDGEERGNDDGDDAKNNGKRQGDRFFNHADILNQATDTTKFERRMTQLREEIKELEAQNVEEKDWVLKGEVTSRARPQDSLLEEDLDFERVTKAVPVVTEESVQDLEARIKQRILENRFDDVVGVRHVEDKPFLPSRVLELKDTKSTQSLAQIYEGQYVAAQTGDVAGEDRDGKLQKEHEQITRMWEGICGKLDALCNAYFTPKQASSRSPKAVISTVSNVPTASLESALPSATSASTMLAPEEIYAQASSDIRDRSELTPAEKKALHNKMRKAKRKTRDSLEKSVDKYAKMNNGKKSVKKQKEEALASVVKRGRGVTVVGKKSKDFEKKPGKR
ncbi:Mpp10 protein, partial [Fistulina hepatica ATCC 64428]